MSQHHGDHPNVVTRNGVNYLRPSAALIFSFVPETENPSPPMYYMGPFTMGQVTFPQDSVVTIAAERAVADLTKRGMLERDDNYKVEHGPTPIYGWLVNSKGPFNMGQVSFPQGMSVVTTATERVVSAFMFFLSARAGGIQQILQSDWFRERYEFLIRPAHGGRNPGL